MSTSTDPFSNLPPKLTALIKRHKAELHKAIIDGDIAELTVKQTLELVDFAAKLEIDNAEHELTFQLRHEADIRALKRWRSEAPGRELRMPDHADMVVWLLKELDKCAEGGAKS